MQKNTEDEAIRTALKGSRWILVRNRSDLSSEETTKLDVILKLCPELRTIYLLKEEYRFFERITNGFLEGLNGAIRNIIRRAFGHRNFRTGLKQFQIAADSEERVGQKYPRSFMFMSASLHYFFASPSFR
jgi:transposase